MMQLLYAWLWQRKNVKKCFLINKMLHLRYLKESVIHNIWYTSVIKTVRFTEAAELLSLFHSTTAFLCHHKAIKVSVTYKMAVTVKLTSLHITSRARVSGYHELIIVTFEQYSLFLSVWNLCSCTSYRDI